MIVCPNCNHQNPEGATQCESCYTPLPVTTSCPNCGTSVQADASFCGQCGFNLQETSVPDEGETGGTDPDLETASEENEGTAPPATATPDPVTTPAPDPTPAPASSGGATTQLQTQTASLLHLQTDTNIELPANLSVVHVGKPGGAVPPDIDVSGFPDSAVVSRVHADIRSEADAYYIEDVGSSNGTYINHTPLQPGNRHRLRAGDRIALGKEDKVTFIFQVS
ncbi:FHA domain-containing protein [Spirulina sp. CS-785/01]|uniref:FHA domain-containing protein n=1 Tax=Spirulina sp. CS-785/01 TaxID=3021716 RepID=UPI00232D109C|nr:FHA domain-containing protein [Spirulina sp. CS-785/01]MDB9314969.1 FHA domain-containing protein [Spirulina sp. CS-785/01]